MEKSSMVLWPDHKTKKRSAYEMSLWFCNLWFPLHICSVSLVSLSYHEPPASFFWLLILWVILSWIPLMSPKYLNGSSHISPLQIRSTSYLLFYHNRILSSSFLVLQSYLCLAAVILRSFIFAIKVHLGAAALPLLTHAQLKTAPSEDRSTQKRLPEWH